MNATRGVETRSIAGSSARFKNKTTLSSAPDFVKSCIKKFASSNVIPIAPNTTANSSLPPSTFDCRIICAAKRLWGNPEPENIGSFCPRTRVLIPSIDEMPV